MKLKTAVLAAALLFPLLSAGCGRGERVYDAALFAMDTVVTLRFGLSEGQGDGARLEALCREALAECEAALSVHDPASPVALFNAGETETLPPDGMTGEVARASREILEATGGAFDCTLGPLASLWNIAGGGPVPDPDAVREALSHTGEDRFDWSADGVTKRDPEAALDFGGIGKGYAAGVLADLLREDGAVGYAVLSLGGNVGLVGEKPDGEPFRVGVKDPRQPDALLGTLSLRGGFVAVSGDYERYFEEDGVRYCHIFDGRTGYPAESGLISAAAVSEDPVLADALSTALFVMGEEEALAFYASGPYAFEAVLVSGDGGVTVTPGIADAFSLTAEGYFLRP